MLDRLDRDSDMGNGVGQGNRLRVQIARMEVAGFGEALVRYSVDADIAGRTGAHKIPQAAGSAADVDDRGAGHPFATLKDVRDALIDRPLALPQGCSSALDGVAGDRKSV